MTLFWPIHPRPPKGTETKDLSDQDDNQSQQPGEARKKKGQTGSSAAQASSDGSTTPMEIEPSPLAVPVPSLSTAPLYPPMEAMRSYEPESYKYGPFSYHGAEPHGGGVNVFEQAGRPAQSAYGTPYSSHDQYLGADTTVSSHTPSPHPSGARPRKPPGASPKSENSYEYAWEVATGKLVKVHKGCPDTQPCARCQKLKLPAKSEASPSGLKGRRPRCERCKKRHQQCDGVLPCERCRRAGVGAECVDTGSAGGGAKDDSAGASPVANKPNIDRKMCRPPCGRCKKRHKRCDEVLPCTLCVEASLGKHCMPWREITLVDPTAGGGGDGGGEAK